LLKKALPIVFVPHAFRLAPITGHAELNASFALHAKCFHSGFALAKSHRNVWELHPHQRPVRSEA
jgi:hypothetical protein